MVEKACTCQQTPADPERKGVGDACLCEARVMTVGEATKRLKACGGWEYHRSGRDDDSWGASAKWHSGRGTVDLYLFTGGWRARGFALADLVERIEAMEAKP